MTRTIDMTPTWGEIGNIHRRLVDSHEIDAARAMASEIAKALAAAQALYAIQPTLNQAQHDQVLKVMADELGKQGFGTG